ETGGQVQRRGTDGAAARTSRGPGGQAAPRVGARLERGDGRDVGLGRAVLEVLVQERPQHLAPEPGRGVAAEPYGAQRAAVRDFLAVVPRSEDEEHLVVAGVLWLDRLVDGGRAVDVLLVPEAVDQHHRHLQGQRGQDLVHGLVTPEGVIARVL